MQCVPNHKHMIITMYVIVPLLVQCIIGRASARWLSIVPNLLPSVTHNGAKVALLNKSRAMPIKMRTAMPCHHTAAYHITQWHTEPGQSSSNKR